MGGGRKRGKEKGEERGVVLTCTLAMTSGCHSYMYLFPCCPVSPPVSATVGSPLLAVALSSLHWHQRADLLGSRQSALDHV